MHFTTATLVSVLATLSLTAASTLKWDDNYSLARNLPLTSFACSDGANGLITKYKDPSLTVGSLTSKHLQAGVYVAATPVVPGWNSPLCGECFKARDPKTNKSFKYIAIDHAADSIVVGSDTFTLLASPNVGALSVRISALDPSECYKN